MLDIGGTFIDQAPNAMDLVGSNGVLPIRDLNLSDCNLVDEDIPDDIKCFSLLEILDLSKNCFVRLKN
ncbi:hypothetical protein Csa_014858 [Cucumis sativus]|uniref:Uncharacterized protein n=1 Tax=Cucumis sativus TaxID=3659 RepID=A0A0A0KZJ1_CUCSA|nr:hypothetical protein Csa_014858 [Cucumis sativus]